VYIVSNILTFFFIFRIITNETNLTLEKLIRIEKRETWFKPKEMVKYGFASKIITNLDEI
jgi:ATP-dependent protease ClpP protease subunit